MYAQITYTIPKRPENIVYTTLTAFAKILLLLLRITTFQYFPFDAHSNKSTKNDKNSHQKICVVVNSNKIESFHVFAGKRRQQKTLNALKNKGLQETHNKTKRFIVALRLQAEKQAHRNPTNYL